jgi:hypothetical protein
VGLLVLAHVKALKSFYLASFGFGVLGFNVPLACL